MTEVLQEISNYKREYDLINEKFLTATKENIINSFNNKIMFNYNILSQKEVGKVKIQWIFNFINKELQSNSNKTFIVESITISTLWTMGYQNIWVLDSFDKMNVSGNMIKINKEEMSLDSGPVMADLEHELRNTKKILNISDFKDIENLGYHLMSSVDDVKIEMLIGNIVTFLCNDSLDLLKNKVDKELNKELNKQSGSSIFKIFLDSCINQDVTTKISKNKI